MLNLYKVSPIKFVYIYYKTSLKKCIKIFWDSLYLERKADLITQSDNVLGSPVSRGSEVRDLSEVSGKSCSTESQEIIECLPDSPEKSIKDASRRLPTLKEIASVDAEVGSLERSGSRSLLEITCYAQ